MNILTAKSCLIAALTGLILPLFSSAASFDCAKAATNVETLICSDAATSQQDEQLAQAYKAAMEESGNKELLRQEQREWLKEKRNACKDSTCLTKVYQTRIQELEANTTNQVVASISVIQSSTSKPRFELTLGKQYKLCREFLDLVNRVEKKKKPNCGLDYSFDDIARKQGFKDFSWKELSVDEHRDMLLNNYVYQIKSIDKNKREKLENSFNEYIFPKKRVRLWESEFDLNGDKIKDLVYRITYSNCDRASAIYIGSKDSVFDELAYARRVDGNPFFYQGKAYVQYGNGVQEGIGQEIYVFKKDVCYVSEIK